MNLILWIIDTLIVMAANLCNCDTNGPHGVSKCVV